MKPADAITLIQNAIIGERTQRWADLGSGDGTFTYALQNVLPPVLSSHKSPASADYTCGSANVQTLHFFFPVEKLELVLEHLNKTVL